MPNLQFLPNSKHTPSLLHRPISQCCTEKELVLQESHGTNKQTNKLSDYVMLKQAVNATTIVLQSRVSRQGFVDSGVLGVVSKALASFDSIY